MIVFDIDLLAVPLSLNTSEGVLRALRASSGHKSIKKASITDHICLLFGLFEVPRKEIIQLIPLLL